MTRRYLWLLPGILLLVGGACTRRIVYEDPGRVEQVNTDYGVTDLQTIANQMADSFLTSPYLAEKERPKVMLGKVRNKTDQHIDTDTLTRKLRVALLKSGRVGFVERNDVPDELMKELEFQVESGYVDENTAHQYGKIIGAEYYLKGMVDNIEKTGGRVKDVYYIAILELVKVDTWEYVWADEVEIRKIEQRPIIGR